MSSREDAQVVQQQLGSLRMVVGSFAAALPILGVVVLLIAEPVPFDPVHLAVCVGLALGSGLLAMALTGTLLKPLDRDQSAPVRAGMAQLRSATVTQAAIAEAGGLVGFALVFALEFHPGAALAGLVVAAVMVLVVAWPGQGRLRKARARLDAAGASCRLDQLAERRV